MASPLMDKWRTVIGRSRGIGVRALAQEGLLRRTGSRFLSPWLQSDLTTSINHFNFPPIHLLSRTFSDGHFVARRVRIRAMEISTTHESSVVRPVRAADERLPSMQRQTSNPSSTSSDILVAHGPLHSPPMSTSAMVNNRQNSDDGDVQNQPPSNSSQTSQAPSITAAVADGRILTIRSKSWYARDSMQSILSKKPQPTISVSDPSSPLKPTTEDGNLRSRGPNHRGTYSKEHTMKHPEIEWIHRGQGRYLPASEIKNATPILSPRPTRYVSIEIHFSVTCFRVLNPIFRQSSDRSGSSAGFNSEHLEKMIKVLATHFDDHRRAINPFARETGSPSFKGQFNQVANLIRNNPRDQWPRLIDNIGDPNYREVTRKWNRLMDQTYPSIPRSEPDIVDENGPRTRLARQTNPISGLESRRSSRLIDNPRPSFTNSFTDDDEEDDDNEDQEDGDDEGNMSNASEEPIGPQKTFNRRYVESHPDEDFHHVGNGWYRRGSRPKITIRSTRGRDISASGSTKYGSEASYDLDSGKTIHHDDLSNYPGMTFHHTGNGWYKPGPSSSERRVSITVTSDGQLVSWKNGRYNDTSPKSEADENDFDGDISKLSSLFNDPDATVNKAYARKHPEIEWFHRGSGRYRPKSLSGRRGSDPDAAAASLTPTASSDRRSSRNDEMFANDFGDRYPHGDYPRRGSRRYQRSSRSLAEMEEDGADALYDKTYVEAHPGEEFHHRGQGRYARGPRVRPSVGAPIIDDQDSDGLVDSAYVHQHPDETFHHRGQGKWARGLPPPGSSNKVAVRGPGAKEKTDGGKPGEMEDEDGNKPPGLTALVLRVDGPEKWPNLQWFYRGGGKWCRMTKEQVEKMNNPSLRIKRPRLSAMTRGRSDGAEAQLQRETLGGEYARSEYDGPRRARGHALGRGLRKRNDQSGSQVEEVVRSKVSSNSQSKAPTPRPALLPPEEDRVLEEDLPSLYKDDWSSESEGEMNDAAGQVLRQLFKPLAQTELFVKALTKHDPAVRSLESLKALAENAQWALEQIQDEYLEIDKIVAQHPMSGKKERKPFRGGRNPVDIAVFEDRKEATLYDYTFDARKVGYQDPDAQRIVRDAEGRELRRRRNRVHTAVVHTQPGPEIVENAFGGEEVVSGKRAVKPVSRFDGVVVPPSRKRSRITLSTYQETTTTKSTSASTRVEDTYDDNTPRLTPDLATQPSKSSQGPQQQVQDYKAPTRGRWKDHVPKRIRELRGESVNSSRSSVERGSPKPGGSTIGGARKGRPPGSKNLHKRKDAGIKKGPRKAKTPNDGLTDPRSTPNPPASDASSPAAWSGSVAESVEQAEAFMSIEPETRPLVGPVRMNSMGHHTLSRTIVHDAVTQDVSHFRP